MADISRAYPARPFVAVGAVVWRGEDVLMIRRAKPPREGHWTLPGGAQETGETLEEALIREVREETGVEIEIIGLLTALDSIIHDDEGRVQYHYTLIDYTAEWRSGEPVAGDDEHDAAWMPPARLKELSLWEKTRAVIEQSRAQYLRTKTKGHTA